MRVQVTVWGMVALVIVLSFIVSPSFDLLNIGLISGIAGVMILWWQSVLGIRQLATIFGDDLSSINKVHAQLGKYGYLLILIHPIVMSITYGVPATESFPTREIFVTLGLIAFGLLSVIWVASALIRSRLPWRWWKRIHLIAYPVIIFVFLHSSEMGNILERNALASDILKTIWYTLAITFTLIVLYRLLIWAGLLKSTYKLVSKKSVTGDITQYELAPQSGRKLNPQEGQFAYIQQGRFGESHPFTISNYEEETGNITFSIKGSGKFTNKLAETTQEGESLYVDGPYGVFTRNLNDNGAAVIIAGGIGITPFLRWILQEEVQALFYANRTIDDIAYKQLVNKKVKTTHVLSGEQRRNYEHGYVTAELIESTLGHDLGRFTFYICGPPPMMDAVTNDLVEHGVRASRIKTERFSL